MRYKIRFKRIDEMSEFRKILMKKGIHYISSNIRRFVVSFDDVSESTLKELKELGYEITEDSQYDMDTIRNGKVYDEDGKVIGEQG